MILDSLPTGLRDIASVIGIARRAAQRLSSKPLWWKQLRELIHKTKRELSKIDPQHEAVGDLLEEVLSPVIQEGVSVVEQNCSSIVELEELLRATPSFRMISNERLLDAQTLRRGITKWFELLVLYLPDYPLVIQAVSLDPGEPGRILRTITAGQPVGALVQQPLAQPVTTDDPNLKSLRRSALRGIEELLQRDQLGPAWDQIETLRNTVTDQPQGEDARFNAHLDLRAAHIELKRGRANQALELWQRASKYLADDPNLTLNEVQILISLGRLDAAEKTLASVAPEILTSVYGRFIAASLEIERSQYRAAIALLKPVLGLENTPPEAYANAAICHARLGEIEPALQLAEKAIAVSNGLARFHVTLGDVCLRAFHQRLAEKNGITEHLSLRDEEISFFRPEVASEVKKEHPRLISKALESYEAATRQDKELSKSGHLLGNMGLAFLLQGDHAKAAQALSEAANCPDVLPRYIPLIDALIGLKQFDKAVEALNEAETVYPPSLQIQFDMKRSELFMKQGLFKKAIEAQTVLIESGKSGPEQFWNRGIARAADGDVLGAIADYEEAVQRGLDEVRVRRAIADLYERHSMPGSAIAEWKRVIGLGVAEWSDFERLARLQLQAHQSTFALETLESFPGDVRANAERLWFLAEIQLKCGRHRDALVTLSEIRRRFWNDLSEGNRTGLEQNLRACAQVASGIVPPSEFRRFLSL